MTQEERKKLPYAVTIEIQAIGITIDCKTELINGGDVTVEEFAKFLVHSSPGGRVEENPRWKELCNLPEEFQCENLLPQLKELVKTVTPFTYKEAFLIKNDTLRAQVFGLISPSEMVKNLGHERIKTAGRTVNMDVYDDNGKYLGKKEYEVVYEMHRVNGSALGVEDWYAIKCWDTTTNEEHWLMAEEAYKDDPLAAIASTCRPRKTLLPYITGIIRQGDIFLYELSEPFIPKEDDERVPLTVDQYFSLLRAQS